MLIRAIDKLTGACAFLASLVIAPLILSMVYEVLSRYVLAAPTFWAFELSYMMMGCIFFFGIAYALKTGQHVNVDFISSVLPRRLAIVITLVSYTVLLALVAWLTFALYQYAVSAYQTGEGSGASAWNPKIWPYRVVYTLGFAVFALQILAEIMRGIIELSRPRAPRGTPSGVAR